MEPVYFFDKAKEDWNIPNEFFDAIRFQLSYQFYTNGGNIGKSRKLPLIIKFKSDMKILITMVKLYIDHIKNYNNKISNSSIISFSNNQINNSLQNLGFNAVLPFGNLSSRTIRDFKLIPTYAKLFDCLYGMSVEMLQKGEFLKYWLSFTDRLSYLFQKEKIKAVLAMNDTTFFQNTYIHVAKKSLIPSAVFLHGFPNLPNNETNNRADFFLVWGEYFKKIHVMVGLPEEKIKVVGHPFYKNELPPKSLRFSLENTIILTKPGLLEAPDKYYLGFDIGPSILYLHYIKKVLKKIGVNKVTLRPHPSENINWYQRYVDNSFFKFDKNISIKNTLKNASLVIGPTSTAFFDSIHEGVHYCIFEPVGKDGTDLLGIPPLRPFDGTDERIPVALSEEALFENLSKKRKIDTSFWSEYIQPDFNLTPFIEAVNGYKS